MVNEALIITLLGNQGDPVECDILDNIAIPKGTVMELEDDLICKKVSGAGVAMLGVSAVEKKADDGVTKLAVITNAIVKLHTLASSGNAVLGEYLRSAGSNNHLDQATTLDHETGKAIFKALETVAADADVICLLRT